VSDGPQYRVVAPGPAGASADAPISAAIHAATGSEIVVLSGRLIPGCRPTRFDPAVARALEVRMFAPVLV
jgi:hypothetical protein